jgi:hypothetical protein
MVVAVSANPPYKAPAYKAPQPDPEYNTPVYRAQPAAAYKPATYAKKAEYDVNNIKDDL